jgi:hypothetical protein
MDSVRRVVLESNKRWWALVAVALGTFITDLDTSIAPWRRPSD